MHYLSASYELKIPLTRTYWLFVDERAGSRSRLRAAAVDRPGAAQTGTTVKNNSTSHSRVLSVFA
jgi:hypothetical protein